MHFGTEAVVNMSVQVKVFQPKRLVKARKAARL
jgi:hypothetical protein